MPPAGAAAALVLLVALARRWPAAGYRPPLAWITAGRLEFALVAAAVALLSGALLPQVRTRALRLVFGLFLGGFSLYYAPPFWMPLASARSFAGMETTIDRDGVCLQSNGYTCGPAAAVTALHARGIGAGEGDLALRSFTTVWTGTQPDSLAAAINDLAREKGLQLRARAVHLPDLQGLAAAGPALALIEVRSVVDHFVHVVEVRPETVVVGDPLFGRRSLPRTEFEALWRNVAVVFQ